MIVGNKEIRTNRKKRKQIQERRIKNLTLITSVIELALIKAERSGVLGRSGLSGLNQLIK